MFNPYLPDNVFIPDGEPHVYGDRVYLYGSHDLYGGTELCRGDYQCWSAPVDELDHWRNEGTIYRKMQDPYIKSTIMAHRNTMFNEDLYAPDVVKVGSFWYLYYGVAMSESGIGVAKASSPTGPFQYLGRVHYPKKAQPHNWQDIHDGIDDGLMALANGHPMVEMGAHPTFYFENYPYDPALLYDNERLFMYFGCGYCYVCEIDPKDMMTLKPVPELGGKYVSKPLLPFGDDPVIKEKQDGWHMGNGSSIRKIGEYYYLSYYAANKNGGNALCYSLSTSPFGPFYYAGVLISLGNVGYRHQNHPTAYQGNTHGGLFHVHGHWYQSYHRQTGDPNCARQACLTELIMDDGVHFKQSEFKTQVQATGGLKWNGKYPASAACVLLDAQGINYNDHDPQLKMIGKKAKPSLTPFFTFNNDCQVVTRLSEGCVVGFKYLNFTSSPHKVSVTMNASSTGGIDVFVANPLQNSASPIAHIQLDDQHQTFVGKCQKLSGVKPVYFVFHEQEENASFVSFQFC